MREIVAVEYRESDWSSPSALAGRVAEVAQACADRRLGAVGVAGLLAGRVRPLTGLESPAMLFGLRAETLEAVVAVGGVLAVRGFSCIYGWVDEDDRPQRRCAEGTLAGHGLIPAFGADRTWLDCGPGRLREAFAEAHAEREGGRPHVWMPKPDRFERAVDGVFVEEAGRRDVDLVWVPGDGINAVKDRDSPVAVVEGRRDTGEDDADRLARWAAGDRVERGRSRVRRLAERPRRWLREITGLR